MTGLDGHDDMIPAAETQLRADDQGLLTLVDAGVLSAEQLESAVLESRLTGKPLARVVKELGIFTAEQRGPILACLTGCEFVHIDVRRIDTAAAALLPGAAANRYLALPIGFDGDRLVIAVTDPTDVLLLDDLRLIVDRPITLVVAPRQEILEALERLTFKDSADALVESEPDEDLVDVADLSDQAPIVRAVSAIISQAVRQRASDVHIESEERDVKVRFRIDGVMHDVMTIPRAHHPGIVSRLKVMAEANIAERRLPQDGRATVTVDGRTIDLRVVTLPSTWGEDVVLRILDRSSSVMALEALGYADLPLRQYQQAIRKTFGSVLVTGPTGSGKSTTLYATLNVINSRDKKIVTVEDPVEYRLPGLRQIQTFPAIGLTFANALRSILRADPDVIMVGEIRDAETADMAIQSALTGHLVLTTLHTSDAPSAITRLVDMGVEPFLVASAVKCVMAQRLARRLCARCKSPTTLDPELMEAQGIPCPEGPEQLYGPVGCRHCSGTGYLGRVAIAEVMLVSEEIERLAALRRPTDDIREAAVREGMRPLLMDGMDKVRAGMTSVEEILRVVA